MRLTILGVPQPKQSARFKSIKAGNKTFIKAYKDDKVEINERNIRYDVKSQLPNGFKPFDTALAVKVLFVFPPLKTFSTKTLEEMEAGKRIYKTTKPDLTDNLMKGLFDAMEGVVYINDSRVCKISSAKLYGKVPRIEIEITEI